MTMNRYIWQNAKLSELNWDSDQLLPLISDVRNMEGHISGLMSSLGFEMLNITSLDIISEDILRSSEIEGVILNADKVRSSVARNLGIEVEGLPEPDHYTEGVVQIMIDAVRNYHSPLTHDRLFSWHSALFPNGRSGLYKITVGAYRVGEEPMQVVSGAWGKERIHYEAPPSDIVPPMMDEFIQWVESDTPFEPVLKAAIAHLWFVVIHPFDDGNGRLTRTITDMLLSRADGMPHRFYSMSAQILQDKKAYYETLEKVTCSGADITPWLKWFLETLRKAILHSQSTVDRILAKSHFWEKYREVPLNERQTKVLNKLWGDFEGKLSTSKWAKMTHSSQATALRDISDLLEKGLLKKTEEGGRSTNYELNID